MTTEPYDPRTAPAYMFLPLNTSTYLAYHFSKKYNEVTLGDLTTLTEWDLHGIRGIGPKSIDAIKATLAEDGLSLHPDPVIEDELQLWQAERMRLARFGEWVREADPALSLHTVLHEFLVKENQHRR